MNSCFSFHTYNLINHSLILGNYFWEKFRTTVAIWLPKVKLAIVSRKVVLDSILKEQEIFVTQLLSNISLVNLHAGSELNTLMLD